MSQKVLEHLVINWQNALLANQAAIEILRRLRGIEYLPGLGLGIVKTPKREDMPDYAVKALESLGLLDPALDGMIGVPLRAKDKRITNFLMLSQNDPSSASASLGTGDRLLRRGGVLNLKVIALSNEIVLVDNLEDYFLYFQKIKQNVSAIIQSDMMQDLVDSLVSTNVEKVILLNDSPYWEFLRIKLDGIAIKVYDIKLPGGMKLKEFLAGGSGNKFKAMLEAEKAKIMKQEAAKKKERELEKKAEEIKEAKAAASQEKAEKGNAKADDLNVEPAGPEAGKALNEDADGPEDSPRLEIKEEPGELKFSGEDRFYRIRGFARDGFEKIVQLSLEMDETSFPDKIDLSRSQARTRFANIAGAEFEVSPETIREDLAFIYQALDQIQSERYNEKLGIDKKDVHIVTPQEESKAIDLLTKRDLLSEILPKDTERLGYVEDEINKKIYYLAGISRLTEEPISVLNISPPGTGKSFGISTIMELLPPDELLKYSRLTPTALYYKEESELKGRVLYIEEIVGMEESLEALRMLISSGEISTAVTQKDPRTGALKTMSVRARVNTPVLSSGVRDIFDEETMSRFILTYNDANEEHIKRIMKAQSFKYSLEGERNTLQKTRVLKRHRDIQKVLDKSVKVVIPFAEKIMLNPNLHIVTRKQEQYLRMIYNIAFLRQHRREKHKEIDKYGNEIHYVRAEKEDLSSANELAYHIFRYAKDLSKSLDDALKSITGILKEKEKNGRKTLFEVEITKKELMDRTNWPETTARRYLDELVQHEYIVRVSNRGRSHTYRLLFFPEKKESGLTLLDPERL